MSHSLTEEEYTEACESYQGICIACGELRDMVEPDAEGYECEECGAFEVKGMEQALICGDIDIID